VAEATVVHVITRLELGGAQEITLECCRRLDRRRFAVHLVAGPGGLLDAEAEAIPALGLHFEPRLVRPIRPLQDLRCFFALASSLRRISSGSPRPLIVHTHSSKAGILGRWAARRAGADLVVHSIHGFAFHDRQPRWIRVLYETAERLAARSTDGFLPVSEANLRTARRLGLLDGGKPAIVLPSGVDPEAYRPRPGEGHALRHELGIPEEAPLVGMIACLKPQKRPVDFVRVAARVYREEPAAQFFLAGDGELRPRVEAAIARLGLDGIFHLLGWRRDVRRLLGAADVLVLTSLFEGLPRVSLQAMAAGRPMVATAVDGTPEAVVDGRTGFLFEPGDVEGCARHVLRLIRDRELARAMGEEASRRIEGYRLETTLRTLEAFYERLLSGGQSRR
jgi:glycosyltransferase involved in cell wall biosynthesis